MWGDQPWQREHGEAPPAGGAADGLWLRVADDLGNLHVSRHPWSETE